jgi:hypothetical protein
MREQFGDLWTLASASNSVACITTNGYMNARGECVMGRGVALQAKKRYPGLAKLVGQAIRDHGNHVRRFNLTIDGPHDIYVVVFPTKHVWWRPSDLELIRQSAQELTAMANEHFNTTFYLPRPGCANGGLRWEDVKPVLESVGLPDNVVVVDKEEVR